MYSFYVDHVRPCHVYIHIIKILLLLIIGFITEVRNCSFLQYSNRKKEVIVMLSFLKTSSLGWSVYKLPVQQRQWYCISPPRVARMKLTLESLGLRGVQWANRQSQLNLGRPSHQTSGVTGFVMQPQSHLWISCSGSACLWHLAKTLLEVSQKSLTTDIKKAAEGRLWSVIWRVYTWTTHCFLPYGWKCP